MNGLSSAVSRHLSFSVDHFEPVGGVELDLRTLRVHRRREKSEQQTAAEEQKKLKAD
jgi:hypothetical protein